MSTAYLWAKTLHIVAVVAWFAGLFYLPRLFVYHAEALAGPEPARAVLHAQFARMERVLERAIMRPALVLVVVAAGGMLAARPGLLAAGWLQAKLALVAGVAAYHWACVRCATRLAAGTSPMTSQQFRLFNEAPTVLLVLIVFLVTFQHQASPRAAAALAAGFGVLLAAGVAGAARRRTARRRTALVPFQGARA
ncbi:membrane protein [Gemmatimonadetes bacterium T265]|nr:membrane protein [Gemmatimonadetes bacterium T265]